MSKQTILNLSNTEFLIAVDLPTRNASTIIQEVTGKEIPWAQVLRQVKKLGKLEVSYPCGVLIVYPSDNNPSKRLGRWNLSILPTAISQ